MASEALLRRLECGSTMDCLSWSEYLPGTPTLYLVQQDVGLPAFAVWVPRESGTSRFRVRPAGHQATVDPEAMRPPLPPLRAAKQDFPR